MKRYLFSRMVATGVVVVLIGFGVNAFAETGGGSGMGGGTGKIVVILDSDGDGVPDNLDERPGTPNGANVNQFGYWVLENVLFDFKKYDIKPRFYGYLDQVAVVFEKNPSIKVQIQGNTDNIGTAANNIKISLKRAEAVMNYLIKKGVAKDRLSAKGYGFTRPIATNATAEGRALNRRVELRPIP
jgi:OOP family OmpA-OmpF porin